MFNSTFKKYIFYLQQYAYLYSKYYQKNALFFLTYMIRIQGLPDLTGQKIRNFLSGTRVPDFLPVAEKYQTFIYIM